MKTFEPLSEITFDIQTPDQPKAITEVKEAAQVGKLNAGCFTYCQLSLPCLLLVQQFEP